MADPIPLDLARKRKVRDETPPPDETEACPVVALGHENGKAFFLDIAGVERCLAARALGSRSDLLMLFGGNPGWLENEFPQRRIHKEMVAGEVVETVLETSFNASAAAAYLMRQAFAAGIYGPHITIRKPGIWRDAQGRPAVHCGNEVLIGGEWHKAGSRIDGTVWVGVTAKEYAGLAWAAKESGKSAEIMDRGMKRLNVTMGDVTLGKNKDAAAVFAHMGIKLQDSAHHARSTVDVLKDLADGFSKTKDATLRASAAQIIMSRAGVEMLPILMRGRNGLADLIKAGEDYADIGDDGPRDKLKEFGHTWGEMDAAAEGFKTRLSTELAPALQPIVELARDWIMANRDWIATAMASRVQALGDAVKGILGAIDDVHKGTKTWGQVIREGAANHIELTAAVGGLMLVLGSPLLTAIRSAGLAFLSLGRFVRGVTLLMRASPMTTLALALAAVAAVIIEQWDPTLPFFTNILNGIKSVFVSVWAWIEPIVDSLKGAFNWLSDTNFGKTLGLDHLPATVAAGVQYVGNVLTGPAGNPEYAGPAGSLYRPGGPALAAAQQKGEVRVKVDFANAPPGTQVRSDASGIAQPPDTSVGYSNPLAYGY